MITQNKKTIEKENANEGGANKSKFKSELVNKKTDNEHIENLEINKNNKPKNQRKKKKKKQSESNNLKIHAVDDTTSGDKQHQARDDRTTTVIVGDSILSKVL